MSKALIVIDIQNDYFSGGNMELCNIIRVLRNINELIKFSREKGYEIYFIRHISKKIDASFFKPDTYGAQLHKDLDIKDSLIIEKNYPNSFRDTILKSELEKKRIDELIVCGAMTHMCIDTTIRAGFDLGYEITLIEDACATKELKYKKVLISAEFVHNAFLGALEGVFCKILTTKEFIAAATFS